MANENEISVKIVADLEDIKKQLAQLNKSSEKAADGIGSSFGSATGKLALFATGLNQGIELVGKIASAIKQMAVETAILGERAAQVENGFRVLADSAGIASEDLLQGILRANDGIIDQTELLSRSSKLIVAFGKDAERIPELIELSRKIAVSFGIDASDAFDRVGQAIQSGSTKALKNLGLTIDTEKAVRDYAAANGIASNALTETGRAQAIMNAALEQGTKKFKDIGLTTDTVAGSYSKFGNSVTNSTEKIGEAIARSGVLQITFDALADSVNHFTNVFQAAFGTPADKAKAKIIELDRTIKSLNEEMRRLEAGGQAFGGSTAESLQKQITSFNRMRNDIISSQNGGGEQFGPEAPKGAGSGGLGEDSVNKAQLLKNETEFRKQINQIRLQSSVEAIKISSDEAALDDAQKQRVAANEEQLALRKQEIRNSTILSIPQQNQLIEEMEMQHQQNLLLIERQAEDERISMLQNRMMMAQSVDQQIAASAELQSARTSQAWRKSGQLGGAAVAAFSNRTMAAFAAVGAGTATMAEAMKSAFFGMLGDVASAQGKTMFLTNLAPPLGPNPAGMAAGLGLIALGGLLSSMGGGGGLGGGVGGGAGGGPEFGGFGGPGINEAQEKRKEVTINIEGNYFDSQETKLSIVEAVRSASDGNDFTIQRGNRR